jgi:hypothetical protein
MFGGLPSWHMGMGNTANTNDTNFKRHGRLLNNNLCSGDNTMAGGV